MKLRTKIAGTVALPLALAIASAASAATIVDNAQHRLNIGGFVSAQAHWTIFDSAATQDSDINVGLGLGVSRFNVNYTQKTAAGNITYLYENDFNGPAGSHYRLRHAAIMHDGWVAGFTWSGFANLTGLAETIDAAGTSGRSANSQRTATLGKNITLADGMSVGVFVEDHSHPYTTDNRRRTANSAIPDMVVNFKGNFGPAAVFAAARMVQVDKVPAAGATVANKAEAEMLVDVTLGTNVKITDELSVKAAVTSYDNGDLAASVAGQMKLSDQLRTNLVIEQWVDDKPNRDATALWVNAFYKMASGWEWGAELRTVSSDAPAINGLGDKDMRVSLQAKYAF